jgi:hypothetical protein
MNDDYRMKNDELLSAQRAAGGCLSLVIARFPLAIFLA